MLSSAEPPRVTDRVVPRLSSGHSRCNLPRTFGVRSDWLDAVAEDIRINNRRCNDLLFTTEVGTPIPSATPSAHALAPRGQSSPSTSLSGSTPSGSAPPRYSPAGPTSSR